MFLTVHSFLIEFRMVNVATIKGMFLHVSTVLLTLRKLNDTRKYLSNQKYNKKILLLTWKYADYLTVDCCVNTVIWDRKNLMKLQGELRHSDVITHSEINHSTASLP